MHRSLLIFYLLLLSIFPRLVHGAAPKERVVSIDEGAVWQGDFFASGATVEISGTITGDAYIAAAQVVIDGVIEGDLLLLCGSAEIAGRVLGSIRSLAGQLSLFGSVDKHISAVGANIFTAPSSTIGSSVFLTACNADLQGSINSDAKLLVYNVRNASAIAGNLSVVAEQMRMTSKSSVGGSVVYHSPEPAKIDEKARIALGVQYHPSLLSNIKEHPWMSSIVIGSEFLTVAMNFVFTFAFGCIVLRLFPGKAEAASSMIKTKCLRCLGTGLVAILLLPLISLLLLITVIGAPFALALIALNIVGFYTAKIFVVLALAGLCLSRCKVDTSRAFSLFLGLIAYYTIASSPYVGPIFSAASAVVGTGAILLAQREKRSFNPFFFMRDQ